MQGLFHRPGGEWSRPTAKAARQVSRAKDRTDGAAGAAWNNNPTANVAEHAQLQPRERQIRLHRKRPGMAKRTVWKVTSVSEEAESVVGQLAGGAQRVNNECRASGEERKLASWGGRFWTQIAGVGYCQCHSEPKAITKDKHTDLLSNSARQQQVSAVWNDSQNSLQSRVLQTEKLLFSVCLLIDR